MLVLDVEGGTPSTSLSHIDVLTVLARIRNEIIFFYILIALI
ncbi:MAG: hypothetical protein ACI808_001151 [Paraglaciecola sp.]|jgi:hypothetical protein